MWYYNKFILATVVMLSVACLFGKAVFAADDRMQSTGHVDNVYHTYNDVVSTKIQKLYAECMRKRGSFFDSSNNVCTAISGLEFSQHYNRLFTTKVIKMIVFHYASEEVKEEFLQACKYCDMRSFTHCQRFAKGIVCYVQQPLVIKE